MLTLTEDIILNESKFDGFLWEAVSLPTNIQKQISKASTRNEMLEKYGNKAYLLPEKLKFPVVSPDTGEYNCKMIYAARARALQYAGRKPEYKDIAKKAENLYNQLNCSQKMNVKLNEEIMDIVEFLQILEIFNN